MQLPSPSHVPKRFSRKPNAIQWHSLQSLCGNSEIFVRHGFKPCRNVGRVNTALQAAEKAFWIVILSEAKNPSWIKTKY